MRALLVMLFCSALGAQSLFLNAAGPAIPADLTTPAPAYQADQYFTGGVVWTDPAMGPGIWSTLRYAPSFSYDIPMTNGFYTVTFRLLEPNKTAVGQRIFTITANGVHSDPIDIFAMAGANAPTYINLLVLVGNGHLRIDFAASVGNAVVSAMEILNAYFSPWSH
jgi:Malectin domain